MTPQLWTIGHSTRTPEEFLHMLRSHGVSRIVDVRRYPFSRRHPAFNAPVLAERLRREGIAYESGEGLGGRREPVPATVNLGWKNRSFRGYADHMGTKEFGEALNRLLASAAAGPTAVLCAEAVPWRCHRSLIADAVVSRGWIVTHILSPHQATRHALTPFAVLDQGLLMYPAPPKDASTPRLF